MPIREVYFAWVDPGETFNPAVHNRVDEHIVRLRIEQNETEFASASIDIQNPRIGLLNAGRKLWAYISYHNGSSIVPLFFGRVVGIPANLHLQVITLEFVARPSDYGVQKEALAASMRFLPYYDPVFIRPDSQLDPDVVLEGRTQTWHIDRLTHDVGVSDLLVGEDGVEEFQESEVPYESVQVQFDEPAIRRVRVVADVPWEQQVSGSGLAVLTNWHIPTLAGQGIMNSWPQPEANLGGGWKVESSRATSPYTNVTDEEFATWWFFNGRGETYGPPPFHLSFVSAYTASVSQGSVESKGTRFAIIGDSVWVDLVAKYEAKREYKDVLTFDLIADTQPILTDPEDEDYHEIVISGNDVSIPDLINDYEPPIGSKLFRSYFTGERGQLSIQYLLNLARAAIVVRSRAVKVTFECNFDRAVDLDLTKNALLHDRRLPGGQALGKITGYSINIEDGRAFGTVQMGCCIGRNGSIVNIDGEPTYVDVGYVEAGYQYMANEIRVLPSSDIGYTPLLEAPNDDGLVFPLQAVPMTTPQNVTVQEVPLVENFSPQSSSQSTDIDDCGNTTSVSVSSSIDTSPWTEWLSGINTTVQFNLQAVEGGPFETLYPLVVTEMKLPKQIDLEAPSNL